MKFTAIESVIMLVLFVAVIALLITLQFYLSKRESPVPGLVLPVLNLLGTLLMGLNLVSPVSIANVAGAFFPGGIFTLVYLVIYFVVRDKNRKKKQFDRMNIQDL